MSTTMEMEKPAVAENIKLELRRIIRAPRARVYEAWTKPERIQQWFGPEEITVRKVTSDLRVGGAYSIEMERSCDETYANDPSKPPAGTQGRYTEIVPNEKIAFTWNGAWNPSEQTLVTVALRDVPGGTEVLLTHERFDTLESKARHEHGWSGSLDKLERFFSKA